MRAVNIQWDIDFDDGYMALDEMRYDDAAEALGLPKERYANMTTEEREKYAYDVFKSSPDTLAELVERPNEVEIPEGISEDEVGDWLSDEFGYCHSGYDLIK